MVTDNMFAYYFVETDNMFAYYFVETDLEIEIFFKKEVTTGS